MSLKAISRVSSDNGFGQSSGGADNSREIESLNREKERLRQEMAEIRTDGSMDSSEKRLKMQTLSTKISTISGKIQSLAKTQDTSAQQQKPADNEDKKKELMDEKMRLQQEIVQIRSSGTMDEQEKHTEVMKLMMEINSIQSKVRSLTNEDVTAMQFPTTTVVDTKEKEESRADLEKKVESLIGTSGEDTEQKKLLANRLNIKV